MAAANNERKWWSYMPATSPPEMDPGLWSRLPPELLDLVLTFLPLKSLLNLRSTCKHFRSLIFSPCFISKHDSPSYLSSFLLLSHPHLDRLQLHLYNSGLGAWSKLYLSLSLLLPPRAAQSSLVRTYKGLLCFSLPDSSFLIRNLLAGSTRRVDFPAHPLSFELFSLVPTPHQGYKLFLLSSGPHSASSAFVYDSTAGSWTRFQGFNPVLTGNDHQEGVPFHGRLYFTTPDPVSVVSFHPGTGKWEGSTAELPSELIFARLASDGDGKMFMVGGIGRNGISRSVKVWELGREGRRWVEVGGLPEVMCRKFMSVCYHNYDHLYCFWHRGMICVCCYTWPEILYYKVSRGTWHWLPKCPSLPEKWSCGFRWFSFAPELYAFV